jgi:hypothetical protein
MSAILDMLLDLKDENARLMNQLIEQESTMSKVTIKKDMDNTNKIVNSNERIAVLLAQSATANAKSQEEALDILNDICKELEQRNGKYEEEDLDQQYSHLKVMK